MTLKTGMRTWLAALTACCGLAAPAFAVDTPEVEPNDSKATATAVTLSPGDTISGTCTGTGTTGGTVTTFDYWRIKTVAQPLGIYRYRLQMTPSATAWTDTIRGLSQSAVGTIGTGDNTAQTASTTLVANNRTVQWYGFGKQEEIYYRVAGATATTGTYSAVLVRDPVTPIVFTGNIAPGSVTIGPATGNTADIDWWLYDSNLNAIPCAGMDSGPTPLGTRTVTLTPGTYYLAFSLFSFANNQASCAPETFAGTVLDFPNAATNSSTSTTTTNLNARFVSSAGTVETTGVAQTEAFFIPWIQFTVATPATPSGSGTASPNPVVQGNPTTLTVTVVPGGTGTLADISSVVADVSSLTGNASPDNVTFTEIGTTNQWSSSVIVGSGITPGAKTVPFTITQTGAGTGTGSIAVTVTSPPPANDACSGAIALSLGTAYVGDNTLATDNDGAASTCQTNVHRGVWFTFNAPAAGNYRISNCATTGGNTDTVLTTYTGTCGSLTLVGCNDDNGPDCTGTLSSMDVTATGPTTYLIRMESYNTSTGAFSIVVNQLVAIGVCCNNTSGACTALFSGTCASGTTLGVGTACDTSSCPASGICCNQATGACVQIFGGTCASGSVAGTGTTCGTSSCPASATCCNNTTGACTLVYSGGTCPTGTTLTGTGTSCAAGSNPCPASGACCNGTACTQVLAGGCTGGTYQGDNSSCTPNVCFPADECQTTDLIAALGSQTGTTVNATTTFSIQPGTLCPGITTSSGGYNDVFWKFTAPATTSYTLDTCGTNGFDSVLSVHGGCPATSANTLACNDDSSTPTGNVACTESTLRSRIQTVNLTAGQLYYLRVSAFGATTTGAYQLNIAYVNAAGVGSCCVGSACTLTDSANCGSGTFTASGSCSPNPCAPAGVCCRGATCSTTITSAAACSASLISGQTAGASFPTGAACNSGPISNAPCCYADYNKVGGITVNDIFDFLADWFAGSPFANTGGNGTGGALGVTNIFDFLNDWFAGGC